MVSLMTLHIGRPCHLKCTPETIEKRLFNGNNACNQKGRMTERRLVGVSKAHDGPWAGELLKHAHGAHRARSWLGGCTHTSEGSVCRECTGHGPGMHRAWSGHALGTHWMRTGSEVRGAEGMRGAWTGGAHGTQRAGQGLGQGMHRVHPEHAWGRCSACTLHAQGRHGASTGHAQGILTARVQARGTDRACTRHALGTGVWAFLRTLCGHFFYRSCFRGRGITQGGGGCSPHFFLHFFVPPLEPP